MSCTTLVKQIITDFVGKGYKVNEEKAELLAELAVVFDTMRSNGDLNTDQVRFDIDPDLGSCRITIHADYFEVINGELPDIREWIGCLSQFRIQSKDPKEGVFTLIFDIDHVFLIE